GGSDPSLPPGWSGPRDPRHPARGFRADAPGRRGRPSPCSRLVILPPGRYALGAPAAGHGAWRKTTMQSQESVGGAGRRQGQDDFFPEEPFPAHGTVTEGLAEPQAPQAPARPARHWNRPILVTGAPRSGTTWVGRMIASHP